MKDRLPFIDWMKCLGMLIIVYGHTAGTGIIEFTQPFNPKQLGVAFFVFVMGFSLARETRPAWRTVYNRFFEMTLFGWLGALLVSGFMLAGTGDLAESNYLPLLFGVNVLFNYFPANPTTWFIGAYLHFLLFWALVARRWTLRPWMLPTILLFEIVVRTLLIEHVGNYVAYMLITNWISAFILGMWAGQRPLAETPVTRNVIAAGVALVTVAIAWPLLTGPLQINDTFPFRSFAGAPLLLTSVAVTALYAGYTWLLFQVTRRFPDVGIVRLIARNTVIVFIVHMPLVYVLTPTLYQWVPAGWPRVIANLFLFFFCLSLLAEWIRNLVRPEQLRECGAARLSLFWPAFRAIEPAAEKTHQ
jgi:hypothetical protein